MRSQDALLRMNILQGLLAKNISPVATAAQLRTMRKGSNDHLILNIDSGPVHSIAAQEIDVKGLTSSF